MRRFLPCVLALTTAVAVAADPPANKGGKPLKPGNDLPGPFLPYNVTGPKETRGKYNCLVSQYGMEPMAFLFVRNADEKMKNDLLPLLKGLDDALEKNPTARIGSFAVFIFDDLPEVVGASEKSDDDRKKKASEFEALANAAMLKHVILCLDGKADLEKYALDDNVAVTVVLANKCRIVNVYEWTKDQLKEDKFKAVLAEVADKLGAKKK
jgi:hypothetical protein